ncbi:MAG TPA: lamin tail domain-containing protein [Bacteroidales bacterium]|jgi:hypothetical protein|nr:lamin tail domain-containing protein [Bacteroidales bacterium]|tara:strand:- start:155 stop:1135 length:981 start_codon:yes stop_codon:yes gene_type:complete
MKKSLLFILALIMGAGLLAQECTDLFITEYVEGSGNNKAIEIYNPTNEAIDLSLYQLVRYSNGSPQPNPVNLTGNIEPKSTFVVVLDKRDPDGTGLEQPVDSALQEKADIFLCPVYNINKMMYFNGNDAVTLETIAGQIIDLFAKIGPPDTDNGWTNITDTTITWNNQGIPEDYTIVDYGVGPLFWLSWTRNHTLIRKPDISFGVTENPDPFMVFQQWDSIPINTFDSLGFHNCNCTTFGIKENQAIVNVEIYPNPALDNSFTVEASEPIVSIEMFDLSGRVTERIASDPNTYSKKITLDNKITGLLFVTVKFETGRAQTKKLLLK